MVNLLAISGKKYSGKDTVALIIRKKLFVSDYQRYGHRLFAEPIKQMTALLTGCARTDLESQEFKMLPSPITDNAGKPHTYRHIMQVLGTDFGRDILGENTWVDSLFANYNPEDRWILTDCRFPNEVRAVEDRGGIVIRVNRPGLAADPHLSETALDEWPFKYVIENDGTLLELAAKVNTLIVKMQLSHV